MSRRKPTARQLIEGDPRKLGKRKLQEKLASEPIAARGLPDPPEYLSGVAREIWRFLKGELELMQLDARPDAATLEGLCRAYSRAIEADLILDRQGIIVSEPVFYKGEPLAGIERTKKHPAITVAQASWALVTKFCSEFGLSPVSRSRLTIDRKEKQTDQNINDLLAGPRVKRLQ